MTDDLLDANGPGPDGAGPNRSFHGVCGPTHAATWDRTSELPLRRRPPRR
jgi:hypothetical protein